MHRTRLFQWVAVLSLVAADATAADPDHHAATVAPFLDDQTIAVARFDVAQLDIAWLIDELSQSMSIPPRDVSSLHEWRDLFDAWRQSFEAAGGRDAFAVLSLADFPRHMPYFIVPLRDAAAARPLAGVLISGRPDGPTSAAQARGLGDFTPLPFDFELAGKLGAAVFCGDRVSRARLDTSTFARQEQLAEAFEAVGDADVQFVILPNADHRRVLGEFGERLLPGIDGDAAQWLGRWRWAAVGLTPGDNASLELTVRADDLAAATALQQLVTDIFLAAAQNADAAPRLANLVPLARPQRQGDRLRVTLNGGTQGLRSLMSVVAPRIYGALYRGAEEQIQQRLKQIGLATHNYHDVHRQFPPAASVDENGRKLLSWRVHLLPYVEEGRLYKRFRLDEPWDSEHNRELIRLIPNVYAPASPLLRHQGKTTLVAPVGEHTVLGVPKSAEIRDIRDGTSNTMLVFDADREAAVIWTKPDDLSVDVENLKAELLGGRTRLWSVFADGSARALDETLDEATFRAYVTRDGGEIIDR